MKHLKQIPIFKGRVFRGVNYEPKCRVNDILTFRSFLSTSISKDKAIDFAKRKKTGGIRCLFEMEVEGGYPIRDFSVIQKEEEVLLEPFSEFKVLGIKFETIEEMKFKVLTMR